MGRRKDGVFNLTKIEELVLMAVYRLGEFAYGVSIRGMLLEDGDNVSMGSVYFALERMENQGLLTSRVGEALEERGGRGRRYFDLTGEGKATLEGVLERQAGRLARVGVLRGWAG